MFAHCFVFQLRTPCPRWATGGTTPPWPWAMRASSSCLSLISSTPSTDRWPLTLHSLGQYYLGMVPRSISPGTPWVGSLSSKLSSSFRDTRDTSLFRSNDELYQYSTPALSNNQVLKKESNRWSMYSRPHGNTDNGKYCQNQKTLRKSDFWKFWFLDRVEEGPTKFFGTSWKM